MGSFHHWCSLTYKTKFTSSCRLLKDLNWEVALFYSGGKNDWRVFMGSNKTKVNIPAGSRYSSCNTFVKYYACSSISISSFLIHLMLRWSYLPKPFLQSMKQVEAYEKCKRWLCLAFTQGPHVSITLQHKHRSKCKHTLREIQMKCWREGGKRDTTLKAVWPNCGLPVHKGNPQERRREVIYRSMTG